MSKEQIGLGVVAGVCAALFIAAILLSPASPPPNGVAGSAPGAVEAPAASGAEAPAGAVQTPGGEGNKAGGDTSGAAAAPADQAAAPGANGAAAEQGAGAPGSGTPAAGGAGPAGTPDAGSFPEQNRRDVTLFFQQEESENLGPEHRKIFMTTSPVDQAKQIVGELIGGPRDPGKLPTIPPETTLLGLYLDRSGTAYVDLSQDLVTHHPGGSSEEMATIFSIVDSLAFNLKEIKRVRILIGGEERETLKDHLDLRRDYKPDMSIVDLERKP